MAETYTGEVQATEGGGTKFAGVRANTGAAGEFLAIAGDNVVTEQGKRVAAMRVNVPPIGAVDDAVVVGDAASGSLIARIRGIAKAIGAITDVDVLWTADGSIMARLRKISGALETLTGQAAYTTPTHTTPSVTTTTSTALAANTNRKYLLLINDSDTTIYIKFGASAVLNQGIRLGANGGSYEMSRNLGNVYTGAVNVIHGGTGTKVLLALEGV